MARASLVTIIFWALITKMKLKALTPLFKSIGSLPRAYIFYGNEEFIDLKFKILKHFLNFKNPNLHSVTWESLHNLPTPTLFSPKTPLVHLNIVKKLPENLDFLKENLNDFFAFFPSRFNQKASFFQKNASHPDLAFLSCYDVSFQEFLGVFSLFNLECDQDTTAFLQSYYHLFPSSVVGLLDKIPYLSKNPTQDMLKRLLPEDEQSQHHLLIDAFFNPFEVFQKRLAVTAFQEGDLIVFSRFFMNACQKLHQLLLLIQKGTPLKSALFALRFPLFFDKEAFFRRFLKRKA